MLDSTSQKSEGNFSPNVMGDGNLLLFPQKDKLSNEVETMLAVIACIPEVARDQHITLDAVEHPKDFTKKIQERFAPHEFRLKQKFTELHLLYKNSYDEAKKNSGVDEFGFDEMCNYLRNLSLDVLSKNNDNPIESLKILCQLFEDKFTKGSLKSFSSGAIEYFLYSQLVECNVFPNPVTP